MTVGWTADRSRRRVLRDVITRSTSSAGVYSRRALGVAVVSGGCGVPGLLRCFHMPAVLLIGVTVALMSVIPLLGAVTGWAPMVVIAVVDRSPGQVAVIAVAAVVGAAATTWARSRFVTSQVDVGSFVVALGIAAGLSAASLPGAVCGMFLAVGSASAVTKLRAPVADPVAEPVGSAVRDASYVQMTWTSKGSTARGDAVPHERLLLQPSTRTLLRVAVIVVLAFSIQMSLTHGSDRSSSGPSSGVIVAIGLDRPVSWCERRLGVRRVAIVGVGALLMVVVAAGLITVSTGAFENSPVVGTDVGDIVRSFEDMPLVGDRLAELDLERRIEEFSSDAPQLISDSTIAEQSLSVVGGGCRRSVLDHGRRGDVSDRRSHASWRS